MFTPTLALPRRRRGNHQVPPPPLRGRVGVGGDLRRPVAGILGGLAVLIMACSPGGSTGGSGTQANQAAQASRGLVAVVRVEPATVAARAPRTTGVALYLSKRLFNASLGLLDDNGVAQPDLAEALPRLNTDTWQVSADGKMQTTYHLKPN